MTRKYTSSPRCLYQRLNERLIYIENSECIETSWKKTQRGGHTLVKVNGKQKLAHRLAWELFKGQIPDKFQVNHKCHNPRCVNVCHMYIGTQKDNMKDAMEAGRHTCQIRHLKY